MVLSHTIFNSLSYRVSFNRKILCRLSCLSKSAITEIYPRNQREQLTEPLCFAHHSLITTDREMKHSETTRQT